MAIDPITTPDRLAGFLNDPNNRIRANVIIASVNKHGFDALVWLRDLAAFGDPAYRRSALYVIDKLKHPSFIEVLEILICDDDLEVRHMAHKAIHEYADAGVKKAKNLIEMADRMMAKTNMGEQDFHSAMVQMRAPTAQKKAVKKTSKSATEELGEQLLGSDGLKAAGQSIKSLQEQAKVAREKMAARLSQTTASIVSGDSRERAVTIGASVVAVLLLLAHAANAFSHFLSGSPQHRLALIAAVLSWLAGVPLLARRSAVPAALLPLVLFFVPWVAATLDIQDADLFGGTRVKKAASTPESSTSTASGTISTGSKRPPVRPATATRPVHTTTPPDRHATATVVTNVPAAARAKILAPSKGDLLIGAFKVRAQISGKPKSAEILLDEKVIKTYAETHEGQITFDMTTETHDVGGHLLRVRVTDQAGRRAEEQVFVKFMTPISTVTIKAPASGSVLWKDDHLLVDVTGNEYDQVEFALNDVVICTFPFDQAGLYNFPIPIATLTEGTHRFEARARMTDGRIATSAVQFKALNPKPTIAFESPKQGQQVYGSVDVIFLPDSGWKETAIRRVTWSVDGLEKNTLASPPWQEIWEAGDMEPGPHVLKAVVENELERTAEASIRVEVIQPKLAASIKGLRSNQILAEDLELTVEVVSDGPGTTIEEISVCVDNKLLKSLTKPPYSFVLKVKEYDQGPHKLTAEVFRSDGQKFKTSPVTFSTNPSDRRTHLVAARSGTGALIGHEELAKQRLELKEDGVAIASPSLQHADSGPQQLGLLMGIGASMKSEKRLSKAKEAAANLVDGLKAHDRAFLLKFSDTAELAVAPTSDRTKLLQEIEYLAPQRGTAIFDAVARAVEESAKSPGPWALVVFADRGDVGLDGRGPASKRSREEVFELLRRSNVQIHAVSLGNPSDTDFPAADEVLQALAKVSHGRYYNAPTESELPAAFQEVLKDLRSQIRVTFTSPSGAPDGKWHTIEIQVRGNSDTKLRYKPGYLAR
ncbi:MAG TPA: VWA domain-containing protein [Candidatus Ozemobacteraceae bacterium]|nr:VWA domain-containing protein [Candidatus Ozemobacteraceae bacterium]